MNETDLDLSSNSASNLYQGQRSLSESKLFTETVSRKPSSKSAKQDSLKVRKKYYQSQKKKAAKELLSTLKDPSIIVLEDWLKIRGTLKGWTKYWCTLKPGLLIIYKSQKHKSGHRVGTVLLNTCELIERPSKKDGFCFKLFHPLDQSIWAARGNSDSISAITQPLPYSYLIFRAPSEEAGKCWMDALELALRCSSLLLRSMTKERDASSFTPPSESEKESFFESRKLSMLNDSDCERHFELHDLTDDYKVELIDAKSESSASEEEGSIYEDEVEPELHETEYVRDFMEELGQQGEECQTEEVNDENKSLIWTLVKQVRPGMDLSRVVLPTFILEPRSFLDKLTDYYYHADLLSEAVLQEDAFTRMKSVVQWYLSGFYKKPKGLKKPYNPVIGEIFRCYWKHPKTNSKTFYIAEQISHHPPVSAFHVSNRQDGFTISACILTKSRFYGNSLSAILDGTAKLTFLKRGEDYYITMPYAHCKGILIGTLTMELGGKIKIDCPKTGYRAELEFKLRPFLGSEGAANRICGKIRMGADTLSTIEGHWDAEIYIRDKKTGEPELFWNPAQEVKSRRLMRHCVPVTDQSEIESQRLWLLLSEAISNNDMHAATHEKSVVEDKQRQEAKERKAKMEDWIPRLFETDPINGEWVYKYVDLRPWDPSVDLFQYENQFRIQTRTRRKTPVVRSCSVTSLEPKSDPRVYPSSRDQILSRSKQLRMTSLDEESGGSSELDRRESSDMIRMKPLPGDGSDGSLSLDSIRTMHRETQASLQMLQQNVVQVKTRLDASPHSLSHVQVLLVLFTAILLNSIVQYLLR